MRSFPGLVLFVLLFGALAMPSAAADASGIHAVYEGSAYTVVFSTPAPVADPHVTWRASDGESGYVAAVAAPHPSSDSDATYWARLPARAIAYTVEGRTFALAAPPGNATRVAFVADWGRSADSWRVLDAITAAKPDLLIVGGDISYANGRPGKWDEWFEKVETLTAHLPTMTAYGNHETLCLDASNELVTCEHEAVEYAEHFPMPRGDAHDYAFDWGPARFVALDTEAYHPTEPPLPHATSPGEQSAFLRDALAAASDRTPWRIVFFHRPLYSSNRGDDGSDVAARDALLPTLEAGGVDLVLSGHVHAYERTRPIEGMTFVVSGGGGRSLYTDWGPQPDWSARRSAEFEFVVLDIAPERLDVRALRPDGSVLDAFTILPDGSVSESASVGRGIPEPPVAALLAAAVVALAATRGRFRP